MDVYRHKIIVEKLIELIPFLLEEDQMYFKSMLNKSRKIIDTYNWKNKILINPSKKELGRFSANCKKVISANYNQKDFVNTDDGEFDLYKIVESTSFSEHLRMSKILFNRRVCFPKLTPLEKALNESLKLEILKEFEIENKNILIKNQ